jgi:hypothetical protein
MTNEVADPVRDRAHWQFSSSSCDIFENMDEVQMILEMKSQLGVLLLLQLQCLQLQLHWSLLL